MARWRRFRASRPTQEVVSWSIGIVVVLAALLLVQWVAHRLG